MKYRIQIEDESATVCHDEVDEPNGVAILTEALVALRSGDSVAIQITAST